jgi:hypothetical protein
MCLYRRIYGQRRVGAEPMWIVLVVFVTIAVYELVETRRSVPALTIGNIAGICRRCRCVHRRGRILALGVAIALALAGGSGWTQPRKSDAQLREEMIAVSIAATLGQSGAHAGVHTVLTSSADPVARGARSLACGLALLLCERCHVKDGRAVSEGHPSIVGSCR